MAKRKPLPRPVKKIGLWKTPDARHATMSRSFAPSTMDAVSAAPATASLSARLLPEHFGDADLHPFLTAASGQVLVAEGDSWFDYPVPLRWDLLDALENNHGRRIVSLAYRGDTLENMVYGTQGTDGNLVPPDLDKLIYLVQTTNPKAVLYSAGGNDVVGDEFGTFLNHFLTNLTPLRGDYVDYIIHDYAKAAYVKASQAVWAANATTKFVTHGYANALPSGEGVGNIFGHHFVGPWLKPALDAKGYGFTKGAGIVRELLAEFNNMLAGLAAADPRFIYVDFRAKGIGDSASDWANELHLTNDAIKRAAKVFNKSLLDAGV